MFPKSIQSDLTIYNLYEDSAGMQKLLPTIIQGVFWQGSYGANLTAKGIQTTDRVLVMIPKQIQIEGKTYLPSTDYLKLPEEDKNLYWTVTKGDRFINQIITEPIEKAKDLEKKYGYDNVLTVTNFMFNDYGSEELRHFKITGK